MVHNGFFARQLRATTTIYKSATAVSQAQSEICTAAIPSGGVLVFNDTFTTTLADSITLQAYCNSTIFDRDQDDVSGNSTIIGYDPFYASVTPMVYALGTATILSYLLVVLIFITPRSFYVGGPGGGAGFLGARSMVPGTGSSSVIGVGQRPLLQKIATVTVAISLTIATADTFKVAEDQYYSGLMDSTELVNKVVGSTEIRVVRVISDTFLWLAQVQTLIRLFPRHKEKVTIKWLGFALVILDAIFSILENFVSKTTRTNPRTFRDAIPALSYLFELSISLIYASCVSYYSLSKRRFAFWHSKMRNILLVAILSLASVLVPVVFFILDISSPGMATWGEYIRWVGAAAASVVVWEWVERIEALERDERKDGILGREIFDGDEMLDMTPSENSLTKRKSQYFGSDSKDGGEDGKASGNVMRTFAVRPRISNLRRKHHESKSKDQRNGTAQEQPSQGPTLNTNITRPPQAATPISRSDTNSAASTIYAIRYHNVSSPSPAILEEPTAQEDIAEHNRVNTLAIPTEITEESTMEIRTSDEESQPKPLEVSEPNTPVASGRQIWQTVANPFKRRRAEPPAEVAAQIAESNARRSPAERYHSLRERVNAFTVAQRRRLAGQGGTNRSPPMPVTFIPAQPRASMQHGVASEMDEGDTTSTQRSPVDGREPNHAAVQERRNSMPVTFIPPPVPGGRTWSPDELKDTESVTEAQQVQSAPEGNYSENNRQASTPLTTVQSNSNVHSTRGSLIISESPVRIRDGASSSSPALLRRTERSRGATMDSISDRLNSVSPSSMAPGSSPANDSRSTDTRDPATLSPDAGRMTSSSSPNEPNTSLGPSRLSKSS